MINSKAFILVLAISYSIITLCYANTTFFSENFNGSWSTSTPPSNWVIFYEPPEGNEDWHRDSSTVWFDNHSGYATISSYKDEKTIITDSLISPIINCYRYRNIVLHCSTYFQHGQTQESYTAKILGSIDGGVTYPYTIRNYWGWDINPQLETIPLDWAQEKESVRIAYVFSGDINNIQFWCLDNISLTGKYIFDFDASCFEIVNPISVQPPGVCMVSVRLANYGKADLINVPVACSITTWNGIPEYFSCATIDTLHRNDTIDFTLSPWSIPGIPYFYRTKAWCSFDGDEDLTNDTTIKSFTVSWVQNLRYCNDYPVGGQNFPLGEQGWGVKFTPGFYPSKISYVEYFLGNLSGRGRFKVRIVDDDGHDGAPGTTLYESPYILADHETWNPVFLSALDLTINEGSVWIFYIQVDDVPDAPTLYYDEELNPFAQYYKYYNNTYIYDTPLGDWLVNLVLEYSPHTILDNDLRTVCIQEPPDEFVRRPYNYSLDIKARVENIGRFDQSNFSVSCTVKSYYGGWVRYTDVETVPYLAAGHGTMVEFNPSFNVQYNEPRQVIVATHMQADENRSNDRDVKYFTNTIGKFTGRDGLYGYAWYDSDSTDGPGYSWIDTNSAYLATDIGDDSLIALPPLPFQFQYYESSYNRVYVSTNGFLTFENSSSATPTNTSLPSMQEPNCALYIFWDDLILPPDRSGRIYYNVIGQAPSRRYVVTWLNVARKNTDFSQRLNFQIILDEDGKILFQYKDVNCGAQWADKGKSATIGIENIDGSGGLTYLFGSETQIINWYENKLSPIRTIKFYRQIRDVAPISIMSPTDSIVPGPITPQVYVKNLGTEVEETLKVFLSIPPYYDTFKIIPRITPGEVRLLQFPDWDAYLGEYFVTCSTNSRYDQNAQNNQIQDSVSVLTWVLKPPIPEGPYLQRVKNGALAYAPDYNKIFALKGGNCFEFWCYDIATNTWESLPRMPQLPSNKRPKAGCALTYGNGKIYALKGGNAADFYSYNIVNRTWDSLKSIQSTITTKKPKDGAALAFNNYNGLVYATIGNNTNALLSYNPLTNTWQTVSTVSKDWDNKLIKDGGSMTYYNGYLYIFKGNGSKELWRYNVISDQWLPRCTIPSARPIKSGGASACQNSSGVIYFFTGGGKQSLFTYNTFTGSFDTVTPIPLHTNRKKVKKGAALVASSVELLYAFKSGNISEFWAYAYWGEAGKAQSTNNNDKATLNDADAVEISYTLQSISATNPFSITYTLKEQTKVELSVYSLTGQLVNTLCQQEQTPGTYNVAWDGVGNDGKKVSGIYFIKGYIGKQQFTKKIIRL